METNVKYTLVGAFVLVLISFIVLGTIWLSAGLSVESYSVYKVYMKESVSGLSLDAAVEFNGVNVGSVKSIEISKKDPQLVELLLKIVSSTPVSQGTRAMINTRGLTGIGYVTLQDKGTDRQKIPLLPGEVYQVISTSPSLFLRIDTALGQFSDSFRRISVALESLLNKENQQALHDLLLNWNHLSLQLAPLVNSGVATMQLMSTQTLPATNQVMSDLDLVTRNLLSITREIKTNPAILIRGQSQGPLGPGER